LCTCRSFLCTGPFLSGAGFIGSNFVRHIFSERDDTVITLDALTYAGYRNNLRGIIEDPNYRFVEGDVRDRSLVNELVEECDVIVNFAAESHVDRSIDGANSFVSTNVQGTQVLLDAALEADIDRFMQISTDEVYGEIHEGKFTEDSPLNPRKPYAATKASADLLAQSYCVTHDLPVIIACSSNNFGPRQHPEKLIPKFLTRAAAGESLPLYGDGQTSESGRTSLTTVVGFLCYWTRERPVKYTTLEAVMNEAIWKSPSGSLHSRRFG
jgi:dTDP-glucose 4,6-dehydratase